MIIKTVSAFSPTNNPGRWNENTSGGGDMEIQKAVLFHYAVTSNVSLRHNETFYCGLTAVNGEKKHHWKSCGT